MSAFLDPPLDASACSLRSGAQNSHVLRSSDSSLLGDSGILSIPLSAYLQPPAGLVRPIPVSPSIASAVMEPLPPSPHAKGAGKMGPQRVLTVYGRQLQKQGLLPIGSPSAAALADTSLQKIAQRECCPYHPPPVSPPPPCPPPHFLWFFHQLSEKEGWSQPVSPLFSHHPSLSCTQTHPALRPLSLARCTPPFTSPLRPCTAPPGRCPQRRRCRPPRRCLRNGAGRAPRGMTPPR